MEIPALFASYAKEGLTASAAWFRGITPVRTGGTVPFGEAAASLPRSEERSPVVIVDCDSLGQMEFKEGVVKNMKVRGRDIWLMTWIETADDLFDAFNTNAEVVMGPYHASRSDTDLDDILSVSDSFVPVVFSSNGKAVDRRGRAVEVEDAVRAILRIGFPRICLLDTDGRIPGYTWERVSEHVPDLVAFTDRTTSGGTGRTSISPLLIG